MTECLLCSKSLSDVPSWKSLLSLEEMMIICETCSNQFEIAEIKEEGSVIDQITSLYTYNEGMRAYLHQFKFLQDIALAGLFKKDLQHVLKGKTNIVPIPMHPHKKLIRTFAHVEELLKSANIAFIDVLEKVNPESMGTKTKEERHAIAPLFKQKPTQLIKPETYILLDDIYTTGTTLHHAAAVLKAAGAKRVEAVTLIRAKSKGENHLEKSSRTKKLSNM